MRERKKTCNTFGSKGKVNINKDETYEGKKKQNTGKENKTKKDKRNGNKRVRSKKIYITEK